MRRSENLLPSPVLFVGFQHFGDYGQKGNLRKQCREFPAVHVSHGKDVFQNRAVFDKAARPVASFLVPRFVQDNLFLIPVLADFLFRFGEFPPQSFKFLFRPHDALF